MYIYIYIKKLSVTIKKHVSAGRSTLPYGNFTFSSLDITYNDSNLLKIGLVGNKGLIQCCINVLVRFFGLKTPSTYDFQRRIYLLCL